MYTRESRQTALVRVESADLRVKRQKDVRIQTSPLNAATDTNHTHQSVEAVSVLTATLTAFCLYMERTIPHETDFNSLTSFQSSNIGTVAAAL